MIKICCLIIINNYSNLLSCLLTTVKQCQQLFYISSEKAHLKSTASLGFYTRLIYTTA